MRRQFEQTAPGGDGVDAGLLEPHIKPFIEQLVSLGYRPATIRDERSMVRTFDRWIAGRHMSLTDVDERTIDTFLEARVARRRPRGRRSTLLRLLTYLRTCGIARPMVVVANESPCAQLENRYQYYLRTERGLCATTVQTYVGFLRQFVTEHAGPTAASVVTVSASDVATFVRRHARAASPGRAH